MRIVVKRYIFYLILYQQQQNKQPYYKIILNHQNLQFLLKQLFHYQKDQQRQKIILLTKDQLYIYLHYLQLFVELFYQLVQELLRKELKKLLLKMINC
ncbi:unnamed protein product [Paramecium sonneborni]|uniref:Uncharacterized protein n=1 Tax=Paramecium sonneborni TaxID=65129 RepID=A0A8S1LS43_9CILI|nr:unnamed protein product [Paramecium sonneborni]